MDMNSEPVTELSYFYRPKANKPIYCSMGDKLRQIAASNPFRPAVTVCNSNGTRDTITYRDLVRQAEVFAKNLIHLGLGIGDKVAVSIHNSIEWVICEFGIFLAGGVAVNLVPQKSGLINLISNISCNIVIIDNRYGTNIETEALKTLKNCIQIHIGSEKGSLSDGCLELPALLDKAPSVSLPRNIDPDSICLMWSTSGTTGPSKFVPHSHFTILNSWDTFVDGLKIRDEDVIFQERPMSYGLGFPMHVVTRGGTHVYANTASVDEEKVSHFVLKAMLEESVTAAFLPSFYLAEFKRFSEIGLEVPRLRTGLITGQRLDKTTVEIFKLYGKNLRFGYGLTDTLLCSATPHHKLEWGHQTLGSHIFPGIEFKVIGSDGLPLRFGQSGEICIRGPNCTKSYVHQNGKASQALDSTGWFHTGDFGTLRQDGLVTVTGRTKEIIRRSGTDIPPAVVEDQLMTYPGIEEVVALGVKNGNPGDEICACILLKTGIKYTIDDIRCQVKNSQLPKEALPNYYIFLDRLPRLPSGKPDRRALTNLAVSHMNDGI